MGVLKVKVNGVWEEASAAVAEPPPEEVWTGTASPDPALPYELWVDTNTDPPTLKAKNDIGQWKAVTGATESEVEIATVDPTATNPLAEIWYDPSTPEFGATSEVEISTDDPVTRNPASELWYLPSLTAPAVPPALWDVAVTYQLGDWCEHPVTEFWRALRVTVGEEPGVVLDAWTMASAPPAADVPGVLRAFVNGFWQDVVSTDATGGDEVIVSPDEPVDPLTDIWFDTDEPDPPPVAMDGFVMKSGIYQQGLRGPWGGTGWASATFNMAAGIYLLIVGASGVAQATGLRSIEVKLDGVTIVGGTGTGHMLYHYFNVINVHHQMGPQITTITVPVAGSHTISLHSAASVTGDANDFGSVILIPIGVIP